MKMSASKIMYIRDFGAFSEGGQGLPFARETLVTGKEALATEYKNLLPTMVGRQRKVWRLDPFKHP